MVDGNDDFPPFSDEFALFDPLANKHSHNSIFGVNFKFFNRSIYTWVIYLNVFSTDKGKKHVGSMQVRGDKFVILAGSVLSPVSAKMRGWKKIKEMRKASYKDGDILTEEVPFNSASAAAAFVCGININGRGEWIDADSKKTLGQWQDDE